ncbi:velvet factor family protein, partial [Salmonella enterica]|uniref:velvet factor family protein n=1 Tax=Salmonella enterica TaxID=28901 RepID=UPI0020C2B4BE
ERREKKPPLNFGADGTYFSDIDSAFYVIQVDLWSEEFTSEVNLVRHSSNTASISTTQTFSYSALRDEGQPTAQSMQPYSPMIPS